MGNDSQFARLAQTVGAPELVSDPRFATNPARVEHRLELVELLSAHLRWRDAEEWLAVFRREKIPGGPINNEVMAELGYGADEVHSLRQQGIV